MAKFKIIIREQAGQKTKEGEYNVKIRVTHKGKVRYIGTNYYVTPGQIDDGEIVHHGSASMYNIQLRNILNLYERKIMDLGGQVNYMDIRALVNHLKGVDQLGRDGDFFFLSSQIIASLRSAGRESYAASVEYTISEMRAISGPSLLFSEVTTEYLERFRTAQRIAGKGVNTTNIHLRNIRMIYNRGIDTGKVDLGSYPFRRFKIKPAKARDRDLEIDDLVALRDADLQLLSQRRARDLFFLSFYMCGLNFKDLLYAKKEDIVRGRLVVDRIKTDQPLSIKITPQAQEIIDRYAGNKFVLSILEEKLKTASPSRKSILHKDVISQTNAKLKDIASDLKIPYKLSTYFARHSWSSIAFNECEISEDIIGLALGHASPRKVTAGYIKKKYAQVDRANEAVIAALK